MDSAYWLRLEGGRLSRRRFVGGVATMGITAAAAGLVGCSSSNNKNNSTRPTAAASAAAQGAASAVAGTATSGTTSAAARTPTPAAGAATLDSTKGKPGGTFKLMITAFPATLPPEASLAGYYQGMVYSGLLAFRWGVQGAPFNVFTLEPDLAQAMPEQTDPSTLTYKLRSGAKFHNGRAVTSEDVKYTYDRYSDAKISPYFSTWQNWYDHTETPDPQTAVVKMKAPYADAIEATAGSQDGFILAKEFQEGPDVTTKQMGTGPWMFVDYQPPVSMNLKRFPDYYLKPYPYADQVQLFATSDPVARLTNFVTRQVHMPWLVYPNERDQLKQQRPDAHFLECKPYSANSIIMRTDKPPFNDARVRQALSMAIDRKNVRDVTNKGEGELDQYFALEWQSQYGTHAVKDLGDAAKYWNYDPQAAKQLLTAAGITKPIDSPMSHPDATFVGPQLPDTATIIQAGWKQQGVANIQDNAQTPILTRQVQIGQYDGMALAITSNAAGLDRGNKVKNFFFWGPNGEHSPQNNGFINDPQLTQLAQKQWSQFNFDERKQTFLQMEPIIAQQQYEIVLSSSSQTWFWDPSLVNVAMSQEQTSRRYAMKWWFA